MWFRAAGQMGGYFVFDWGKAINFYCSCGISMIVKGDAKKKGMILVNLSLLEQRDEA